MASDVPQRKEKRTHLKKITEELPEKRIQASEVWTEFEWDLTKRKVDCIAEKIWQRKQSIETMSKNLENDFEESAAWAKEFGWSTDEDNPRA